MAYFEEHSQKAYEYPDKAMTSFTAFLTSQVILFLAPVAFILFGVHAFRCPIALRWDIFISIVVGLAASFLCFMVFWPLIFPTHSRPVSPDGQSGLGEGLVMIGLLGVSYLAGGVYVLTQQIRRAGSTRARQ